MPCILLGLDNAPLINSNEGISISELDYLIMPYDALGAIPVFEAVKRGIRVLAVKENITALNITADKVNNSIIEIPDYDSCLDYIVNNF